MVLASDKLILFGDSITQLAYDQDCGFCFGPAMQHVYARKLDVIQRGYGGYNSDHAALIIDDMIEQEKTKNSKIKLMVIFFGTNDSIVPESRNHVPIPRFKDNMRYIVGAARRVGSEVLLIGPGPFNHHQFADAMEERFFIDRTTSRARAYCKAVADLGEELSVPTVPLWDLIMAEVGWKEGDPIFGLRELPAPNPLKNYLTDGVHFAGPAYRVLFDNVVMVIKDSFPALDFDRLEEQLPHCDQLTSLEVLRRALN